MGKNIIDLVNGEQSQRFSAPDSWNDMSTKQLYGWAGILEEHLTRDEAFNAAIVILYSIPRELFLRLPESFLFQLRETILFLSINRLTRNVIGTIRYFGRRFYGPSNRLANISISEYRRTEIYYQLYQQLKKKEYLLLLVATLYRPSGGIKTDDRRCKIDELSVQRRADFFAWAMPINTLKSILIFYEGCRSAIIEAHPQVYPKSAESSDTNPFQPSQPKRQLIDLDDHILAYSGGKLGNYVETSESNLFLFLKHMSQKIDEMDRLK